MIHNLETKLREHVRFFEHCKNRYYTSAGNATAAGYIRDVMEAMGLEVHRDPFTCGNKKFFNLDVRAASPGEGADTYILCAHYDSIALKGKRVLKNAPGADDNASGVAVVQECARLLTESSLTINLHYVFFNLEEHLMKGSRHLARMYRRKGKPLAGVINVDTVGTWQGPISQKNPLNYVCNEHSQPLLELLKKHLPCPLKAAEEIYQDDQIAFWEKGFRAVELTEDGVTPHMHTIRDTGDKLHYGNMTVLTKALADFFRCL